jgi:hypothetical protein
MLERGYDEPVNIHSQLQMGCRLHMLKLNNYHYIFWILNPARCIFSTVVCSNDYIKIIFLKTNKL